MNQDVRRQVLEIYRETDAAVAAAGPVCIASGRCCRFKEYGHTLFLSSFEAEILLASAPPYEKPASDDFCPFQKGKLCTARDCRPLACRIYFCDPNYQQASNAITETALAKLKQLASDNDCQWRYAPLHQFLNE
jgi:Fe-S-cluster containining protein